jgi:hypothetical protein
MSNRMEKSITHDNESTLQDDKKCVRKAHFLGRMVEGLKYETGVYEP